MEDELVLGVILRFYGFVRAHEGACPATVAVTFNISYLLDNINDLTGKLRFRDDSFGPNLSLEDY
jgi:hypothetical protein